MAAQPNWEIRSWLRLGVSTLAAVPPYTSKLKSMPKLALCSRAQPCCGPAPLFRPQRTKYTQALAGSPTSAKKRGGRDQVEGVHVASPVCSGKVGLNRDSKRLLTEANMSSCLDGESQ